MAIAPDDVRGKTILVRQRGDGHIAEKPGKYREIDGCQFSTIIHMKQYLELFLANRVKTFETLRDRVTNGQNRIPFLLE
jgi:hypothetical protein